MTNCIIICTRSPFHCGVQWVLNEYLLGVDSMVFRCLGLGLGSGFTHHHYWCFTSNNMSIKIHKVVLAQIIK